MIIVALSLICLGLFLLLVASFIKAKFDERDLRDFERENKELTEQLERAHRELREAEEKR